MRSRFDLFVQFKKIHESEIKSLGEKQKEAIKELVQWQASVS